MQKRQARSEICYNIGHGKANRLEDTLRRCGFQANPQLPELHEAETIARAPDRAQRAMKSNPLVMCLTNAVAASFTANCLLAVGAKPAMVEEPAEAEELAAQADAILVNLGTVSAGQAEAMRRAVRVAGERRIPWVLDPVGVQCLSFRRQLALELLGMRPSIVRGNAAEIGAMAESAPNLAMRTVLLATGPVDRISGPDGADEISGGVPMLQAVTATGCAQGGICAAFLGRGQSPMESCRAAAKLMKHAGEMAWRRAKAPGSFAVAIVDALWELGGETGNSREMMV